MILRNHGLLACGTSVGQAFGNIYRLERACQTQLLAMACNAEITMPPDAVIARSNAQLAIAPSPDAKGNKRPHGSLEWPALKRMLDRRDRRTGTDARRRRLLHLSPAWRGNLPPT